MRQMTEVTGWWPDSFIKIHCDREGGNNHSKSISSKLQWKRQNFNKHNLQRKGFNKSFSLDFDSNLEHLYICILTLFEHIYYTSYTSQYLPGSVGSTVVLVSEPGMMDCPWARGIYLYGCQPREFNINHDYR
jgi:hypothetical protein